MLPETALNNIYLITYIYLNLNYTVHNFNRELQEI